MSNVIKIKNLLGFMVTDDTLPNNTEVTIPKENKYVARLYSLNINITSHECNELTSLGFPSNINNNVLTINTKKGIIQL